MILRGMSILISEYLLIYLAMCFHYDAIMKCCTVIDVNLIDDFVHYAL